MTEPLSEWLATARGRLILREERGRLAEVLPRLFGRTLLQIGNWGAGLLSASSHWRTGVVGEAGHAGSQVICNLEALPLVRRSVDAVLLPHSLEFARDPHQLLREADRSLTARGQLLILGFNPWAWWGLRQRFLPRYPAFPPGLKPLRAGRVSDWLSVLDYEVVRQERFGPGLGQWPRAWRPVLMPFAASYLILARKRSLPVTPLRDNWRERAAGMDVARLPSARIGS